MGDQLDQLFRVLVRRIRDLRPEHLSRPFEVGEIQRTFAPYRTTRGEVGVESAEDYEVLLLRLLSGERGYVFADDVMQDDLRREMESGNPDLRALHAYGTAKATLAQHAMRQVLESSPAPSAAHEGAASESQPHESTVAPAVLAADQAAPTPHAESSASPHPSDVSAAFEALQRQLPPTLAELGEALGAGSTGKSRASFQSRASRVPDPTVEGVARPPRPGCRFCGQPLPEGREVTFCPHCGQNLRVRRCPGCSAEIDASWKFCVVCGRAAVSG